MTHGRRMHWIFMAPLAILAVIAFVLIGGEIVRLLWNWLMPAIFGLPSITFWQAVGLLALARILFGGFGRHGSGRGRFRRRFSERMADRLAERLAEMTPEERAAFHARMRGRWGTDPSGGASGASPDAG